MSFNWITDRPPTRADGDEYGRVVLRRLPEGDCGVHVHWSYVAAGAPWHLARCEPPAPAPEPAPEPALAPGQTWRRRDGKVVTISTSISTEYPFWAQGVWYRPDGTHSRFPAFPHMELAELVSDVPPAPEAPKTTQQLEPRRFLSISRTVLASGQEIVDAIDDDGVAWELAGEEWRRIKPLPPREVSAAD